MTKTKKTLSTLLLPLFVAGCTSISNLTPSQYPRNSTGYYRVEAAWHTRQQTIRPDSITAAVKVGPESYDMGRIPVVTDRWETFIPVPADKDVIYYHYKFDFLDNAFGAPRADSLMSPEYKLQITGPK